MKARLNKRELNAIDRIADRLCELRDKFDEEKNGKNVALNYGNGSVYDQIGCALAALDCILQEY